ncbi:hypothetical protein B0H11DRAFT_2007639 [Mycena galericulata]|nr:hypothetical protein B0H11DRAFT_2007639 [Mycena galericulata]
MTCYVFRMIFIWLGFVYMDACRVRSMTREGGSGRTQGMSLPLRAADELIGASATCPASRRGARRSRRRRVCPFIVACGDAHDTASILNVGAAGDAGKHPPASVRPLHLSGCRELVL